MDKLLKYALDSNVVDFVARFKEKMADVYSSEREKVTRQVAAEMSGTQVMVSESIATDLQKLHTVVVGRAPDEQKRKGKLVTMIWKDTDKDPKLVASKFKTGLDQHGDKIKHIGAVAKGKGIEVEVELA